MVQVGTARPARRALRTWVGLLLLAIAFLAVWSFGSTGVSLERLLYRVHRQTLIWQTQWRLRRDHHMLSSHFLVLYPPGDRQSAEKITDLASNDYRREIANLGLHPSGRLVIAVYPSEALLNRAVGMAPQQNNIGFYWHGVIDVLGPKGLHQALGIAPSSYPTDGPVAHELGHALLNIGAYGNYPAWFNEGIAQWEDYRLTGYQWLTPQNYLQKDPLYTYSELSSQFYRLPHQSLAYREGLGMVEYMTRMGTPNTLPALIKVLGHGTPFDAAVQQIYGTSIQTLFGRWKNSLHLAV